MHRSSSIHWHVYDSCSQYYHHQKHRHNYFPLVFCLFLIFLSIQQILISCLEIVQCFLMMLSNDIDILPLLIDHPCNFVHNVIDFIVLLLKLVQQLFFFLLNFLLNFHFIIVILILSNLLGLILLGLILISLLYRTPIKLIISIVGHDTASGFAFIDHEWLSGSTIDYLFHDDFISLNFFAGLLPQLF